MAKLETCITACVQTERLVLKPVTERDIPAYRRHFVDYEVVRNLTAQMSWPYPENGVSDYILKSVMPRRGNDYWGWGIFEKEAPEDLIGHVDLGGTGNRALAAVRAHWAIENNLHWTMDVIFDEDRCRTRKDHSPVNFAVIRHAAFNMLKADKTKGSMRRKRLRACVDPTFRGTLFAA